MEAASVAPHATNATARPAFVALLTASGDATVVIDITATPTDAASAATLASEDTTVGEIEGGDSDKKK